MCPPPIPGMSSCARHGSLVLMEQILSEQFCGLPKSGNVSPLLPTSLGCPTSARDPRAACLDIALFCAAKPDRGKLRLVSFLPALERRLGLNLPVPSSKRQGRAGSPIVRTCRYRALNIQPRHSGRPTAGLTARQSSVLLDLQRDLGVTHWRETVDRLLARRSLVRRASYSPAVGQSGFTRRRWPSISN